MNIKKSPDFTSLSPCYPEKRGNNFHAPMNACPGVYEGGLGLVCFFGFGRGFFVVVVYSCIRKVVIIFCTYSLYQEDAFRELSDLGDVKTHRFCCKLTTLGTALHRYN